MTSTSLNIPDQLAKILSHDMPVRGRGGQLKCDSTKKRETTLHQRRLQENAADTGHNLPTKKKKVFVSGCKEKGTRKKLLLVHPIMTTGIHRSFVPNKLTRHKKTSPIRKAHFERATFSANNSDGRNRLYAVLWWPKRVSNRWPCIESGSEVATNDVTRAGVSCSPMLRSWQLAASHLLAAKALRSSKMESDPQLNSRLPHLPPPSCRSQDRGRRQHDAFTTSYGGNRGTTIIWAHSSHRQLPQRGQRAAPAFHAGTALGIKCLVATAEEDCPYTADWLCVPHKLCARTEAAYQRRCSWQPCTSARS